MGPETVCLVHMEPVQNAGGCFTPPVGYWQGVRDICNRYDVLLSADEVITAFGRVGHWFGSERYDIRPDIVTSAKGLSSSYAAIGAVIATDRVMEPFLEATSMYSHGITFGGHPVMCAIALKNIEIMKRERIIEHVRENEQAFHDTLAQLLDLPIVGDLRGTGYFWAIELVKDKDTRETFSDEECERLLRGYLSNALFEAGMICRADDRGDPVLQISPPLVAGQKEFDEIAGILGEVLTEAGSSCARSCPLQGSCFVLTRATSGACWTEPGVQRSDRRARRASPVVLRVCRSLAPGRPRSYRTGRVRRAGASVSLHSSQRRERSREE